ncbi:NUDIX hydrolase [Hyalangium rubrum]|uniref:CoA pyrophosphatase n=1 Tax=Hyalangium rubrum TaxID=3103134 RepID=A0ABU5H649_9BACT|nr:CoA pyrophosphatase [Hyalangium sp. s54d21]MDY7228344.1 CoA pyrophosphatase [Hyalangium sp. s54d21]
MSNETCELRGLLERELQSRPRRSLEIAGFRRAAVLVPLRCEGGALRTTLIVRAARAPTHAGDVAFPGGLVAPGDQTSVDTALREAEEEVHLARASVKVLGLLDDTPSGAGFIITPVVGWVLGDAHLGHDGWEVSESLDVSVQELSAPERLTRAGVRQIGGQRYAALEYRLERHRIWGATARVVQQLLEILERAATSQGGACEAEGLHHHLQE